MNGKDRNMEAYIRSVRRRLNLPKAVKDRVISDFISSIEARREAGMSEEAILAELGSSRKAAAELNDQMKEFTFRKSPWRFACLALAVLSGGWLALYRYTIWFGGQLVGVISYPARGSSVGVIGGADGPTAVFVTSRSSVDWDVLLMLLLLAAGVLGYLLLRRCPPKKKKNPPEE